jgi:ankyrin repeat protein
MNRRGFAGVIVLAALWGGIAGCGGPDVETEGETSIFAKAQAGDANAVGEAIRQGFDVDEPDENGRTLLHHAVGGNQTELVELLIDTYHAQVSIQDADGKTPLDYAQSLGNPQIIQAIESAM